MEGLAILQHAKRNGDGWAVAERVSPDRYSILDRDLPEGAYVRSILAGGRDITERGLDLISGVSTELEFIIADDGGVVTGQVVDAAKHPVQGGRISIVRATTHRPALELWSRHSAWDAKGQFSEVGIAPGEYTVTARANGKTSPTKTIRVVAGGRQHILCELPQRRQVAIVCNQQLTIDKVAQILLDGLRQITGFSYEIVACATHEPACAGSALAPSIKLCKYPLDRSIQILISVRLQFRQRITMSKRSIATFSLAGILAMTASLSAGAVKITANIEDSGLALVGKTITLTAFSTDSGTIRYRFRVRRPGANYRMIRDYGPEASLDWTPDREGLFEIEVSAKDRESGDVATTTETLSVEPRVNGNLAVVNPTSHPLVFLASAPACVADGRMRVKFQTANGPVQQTPFKRCTPGESMNFYLAGLYADTDYSARVELDDAQTISQSSVIPFRTGSLPEFDWQQTPLRAGSPNSPQQVLLATTAGSQIATDLNGNVIWFNASPFPVTYGTAFEAGGYLWGFIEDDSNPVELQAIRKVDLLGQTVLETNAERVNEQLEAMGRNKISGFHHEVRTLPDGRIVALASTERILTDTQGPGDVDVLGDMIIVFDRNLQVLWTWDAFDHLDVTRKATHNEVCGPGAGGCPPFYLAPTANDWTHGNSVRQTPDGDLLFSARHQDWLVKIAYDNGEGDGHIVWKLGKDGDFSFAGSDPYPWFSHQHDGNFESANRIVVFDNGNTRIAANGGEGNSRGQVIELDEENRKASLVLNADLGLYSFAVGSAQRLRNGNYHFDAGYVPGPTGLTAFALEVDGSGKIVSSIKANTLIYRSMRITDMYTN